MGKLKDALQEKSDEIYSKKNLALATVIIASALFLSIGLPGESGDTGDGFNRADVMFMNMMIVHHDQAIEMAELASERTSNENILELSSNISEAQRSENEQMAAWLEELGYQRPRNGHRMAGMASTEQMRELRSSENEEFDRLFAELMITHHRGGIQMAESFSQRGKNPELIEMQKQMVETQQREIEMMENWQEDWN